QCLSTGIRQRRQHPPVGGWIQLEKAPPFKQSSRPNLVGTQEYVRLVARCLQDAPHGGCECHWSLMRSPLVGSHLTTSRGGLRPLLVTSRAGASLDRR